MSKLITGTVYVTSAGSPGFSAPREENRDSCDFPWDSGVGDGVAVVVCSGTVPWAFRAEMSFLALLRRGVLGTPVP